MSDDDTRLRAIENLTAAVTRDLRQAQYGDELVRPVALRAAAEKLADLRSMHTRPDGSVDWQGRSWEYRQRVAEAYNAAGLDPAPNSNVKAALRYHMGQVLRERLSEDELEAAGLKKTSPRDRAGMRYRSEGDEAAFMQGIFLHMMRTPKQPLTAEQKARAQKNAGALVNWLGTK